MRTRYWKWIFIILALLLIQGIAIVHSLATGELKIPILEIPQIFMHDGGSMELVILKDIRLPRIFLGIAIGGALSLAGVILQGVFKNPLVEPYTLGISGGAALGVAIAIVFNLHHILGSFMLPLLGFTGAILTIIIVYTLSVRQGRIKIQHMLLIGVMISFVASSAMMFMLATTSADNLHGIVFWIMGSLDEPNKSLILYAGIVSLVGLLASYLFVQPLNALRLGESKARTLGIDTDVAIRILFLIASILTGVCVAVAGVIGFVGLIIPHLIRQVVGNDYRILLISSFITGGTFLVFSDTIARIIIAPNELPIGVITGILGGVIFIFVLGRSGLKNKLG